MPPPASGPTQTLVPDLLGSTVTIAPPTTLFSTEPTFETFDSSTVTTQPQESVTATIASKTSPSGSTLILASVAWLASLGGLLVYAEDQRSTRWKHLAR